MKSFDRTDTMYTAHVLSVMIASPSDVIEERKQVRDVVYSWNYTDSFKSGLVVLPIGWETHTSPELGMHPQELINQRLVDRCDVLVGVFWTRLGSPTEKEDSGTVEEIKRHHEAGKPVMLYFSSRPVAPESLDQDQWKGLQQFKDWCKPGGLYEPFSDVNDLREKFQRQFRICLNENGYLQSLLSSFQKTSDASDGLQTVTLPVEAVKLLTAACSDDGIVLLRELISGSYINAGSLRVELSGSGREDAKWRESLKRLESLGLIEERNYGSGLYYVTHEGYEAVERNNEEISKIGMESD